MRQHLQFSRSPEAGLPRESFGDLLGELATNSAALVRDEIELARHEVGEKLGSLRSGIIVVAAGALIALVAMLTLAAAAVIGLAKFVGPGNAALIIGATLGLAGGFIAVAGVRQIRRASLKPTQTIETLEENKEWLKELT